MNEKICFKCKITKPLTEFYKHKGMSDGYLNKCKDCAKKDTKTNTENNAEYYREYDKKRAMLPHNVEARLEYSRTANGKKSIKQAQEKYRQNNSNKRAAHIILGNAVRDKKIIKPNKCSVCNTEGRIYGHHDDYAFPLVVRWFCSKCHSDWHKLNGEALNG